MLGASGIATVLTHAIVQRSTPVYNIEVHGEHVYQVGTLGVLVHNAVGCIGQYKEPRTIIKGSGLEAHHLLERRFAKELGEKAGEMMSVVLKPGEHQVFTNAWQKTIPYGDCTATATRETIEAAARKVYKDYPGFLTFLGL